MTRQKKQLRLRNPPPLRRIPTLVRNQLTKKTKLRSRPNATMKTRIIEDPKSQVDISHVRGRGRLIDLEGDVIHVTDVILQEIEETPQETDVTPVTEIETETEGGRTAESLADVIVVKSKEVSHLGIRKGK
jgi:hypothetical protein